MYRHFCTDSGCLAFAHVACCMTVACSARARNESTVYITVDCMQCFTGFIQPREFTMTRTDGG